MKKIVSERIADAGDLMVVLVCNLVICYNKVPKIIH